MKEVTVQFISGRKIVVVNVIDYVVSEDSDVIITNNDEHITLFTNQIEYMIVKDLEEEPLLATSDTIFLDRFKTKGDIENGI